MKKLLLSTVFALFATGAYATCTPPLAVKDGNAASQNLSVSIDPSGNCLYNFGNSAAITNPTSTLTLPATTTQYGAGTQIGSPGSSFSIPNTAGGFLPPGFILTTNDPAWGGATVQIDIERAAPTLTNGDRGAYKIATGSANYLGSYTCTLTAAGDGSYGECLHTGSMPALRLASGASVFWTAQAVGGTTGATIASGVFTLTAELLN
jgi:hypothetical protein